MADSGNFGFFYDLVMYLPEKVFLERIRKRLLSGLQGNILEVGGGNGNQL